MIKGALKEQVVRIINGGDYPTSTSIKEQDAELVLDQARNYLLEKNLNQYGEDISDEFVSVFEVEIKKHTKRNRLYIELPAKIVSLRDGKGLRQISPIEDDYNVWIPLKGGSVGMYHGLEAGNIEGKVGYWMEGAQGGSRYPIILFDNLDNTWVGKEVLLKMIASVSSMDDDDIIPVPANAEIELLQLCVEILSGQKQFPVDKANDNTDKI
jgi:hypothetical protein